LYGYYGNAVTAICSNAKDSEIAFEGFEEFTPKATVDVNNYGTGNFNIYTTAASSSAINTYDNYKIISGFKNMLIVGKPYDANSPILSAVLQGYTIFPRKEVKGSFNVTANWPDPYNPNNTLITLDPAKFPNQGIWFGFGTFKLSNSQYAPTISISNSDSVISTFAHTGKQSIKIIGSISMEQSKLNLIPGKKYFLSSWVSNGAYTSTGNGPAGTYSGATVQLQFKDINKNNISGIITLNPSGNVIESWQKIEGEFTVPSNASSVVLTLSIGSNAGVAATGYFDDIRISPSVSEMKTFVYDNVNYRLKAVLDNNNYATLYFYDASGKLYLIKKETERGIMTVQESFEHKKEH
jgi:hypothetical protein